MEDNLFRYLFFSLFWIKFRLMTGRLLVELKTVESCRSLFLQMFNHKYYTMFFLLDNMVGK